MDESDLALVFTDHRARLRGVAYKMLGSLSEADDAVQESWLRVSRSGVDGVQNLAGWLTTVVARVCLDVLRRRRTRREDLVGDRVPDPVISAETGVQDPEQQALLADSVGLALLVVLVVLETLGPAERLAFVLHDLFGVPFEEIAPIVGRSPAAARQLASRGRRRVQGADTEPDVDVARQREVVDAFFAATRNGDLAALVAVLHPDVVLQADSPVPGTVLRGAETVAGQAVVFGHLSPHVRPALVNGAVGVVVVRDGRPFSVMAFTVRGGLVVRIDVLRDRERLGRLDLTFLDA